MNQLHLIPILQDNYVWLLESAQLQGIIVDPGAAKSVITYLTLHKIKPVAILLTHHHHDHIDGVLELQQRYPNIIVYGPREISLPISHVTDQDILSIAGWHFQVIAVPGHTLGHVAYYCAPYLFCGDTLFSAGCGRIFEGTPAQMFNSLNKLKALPDDTLVCPAHEYTLSNLKFAHKMVADDNAIKAALDKVKKQERTLPTTIAKEKQINLFLRCNEQILQHRFNIDNDEQLFTFFRQKKDNF